jgi:hypothetical protein
MEVTNMSFESNGDMKDVAEMLETVTEKLPKLINGIIGTMYNAEAGKNVGQAVGALYKELLESGIPKEDAIKMARDYIMSLKDIPGMVK